MTHPPTCPRCSGQLLLIQVEDAIEGVRVVQPARRCAPCGVTVGDLAVGHFLDDGGALTLIVHPHAWRVSDEPETTDDGDRLFVEQDEGERGDVLDGRPVGA